MGQQKNRGIIGILTGGGDVPGAKAIKLLESKEAGVA